MLNEDLFLDSLDEIQHLLGEFTEFDELMFNKLLEINCPKKMFEY